jgi:hypothetical protein
MTFNDVSTWTKPAVLTLPQQQRVFRTFLFQILKSSNPNALRGEGGGLSNHPNALRSEGEGPSNNPYAQ